MDNQLINRENKPQMMQMILEKSSKIDLIRAFGKMDLYTIAKQAYPSLGELARSHSQATVENAVAVLVADLNTTFDGVLKSDQIMEVAIEVMSGLTSNMPLELLFVALNEMKYEDHGTYGKLSMTKILRACKKKFNEYQQIAIARRESEHYQIKQQPVAVHANITKMWKDILEAIPNDKEENRKAHLWYSELHSKLGRVPTAEELDTYIDSKK